jgi:hypothetical protein
LARPGCLSNRGAIPQIYPERDNRLYDGALLQLSFSGEDVQCGDQIGESEIALEHMGFNPAMLSANITTAMRSSLKFSINEQGGQRSRFFIIIAGTSAEDFAYKKKVLNKIIADNEGESFKHGGRPEIEGILLAQCTRVSASIRETFRLAAPLNPTHHGPRDLTIKWAIGRAKPKCP